MEETADQFELVYSPRPAIVTLTLSAADVELALYTGGANLRTV
jgi:hypothetical protein